MFHENIMNFQIASIQYELIQIQCRKDQMQVSHVEKHNVEQSSTIPNSHSIRSTKTIPWA